MMSEREVSRLVAAFVITHIVEGHSKHSLCDTGINKSAVYAILFK